SGAVSEAGEEGTFSVVLATQPTSPVTIALGLSVESEATLSEDELVFDVDDWDVPQAVTISAQDDDVDDGDRPNSVLVTATSDDADYDDLELMEPSFTTLDDDTAGIVVSAASGPTTEAGGEATFTVVLASEPTAPVTIALESDDTTEGIADLGELEFTPLTWDTPQTVTVTGQPDEENDVVVAYQIDFAEVTSLDEIYAALSPSSVDLQNESFAPCVAWAGDDFDDGDASGWTTSGDYTTSVVAPGADSSPHALSVAGGIEDHYTGATRTFSTMTPEYVSVYVRTDEVGSGHFVLADGGTGVLWFQRSNLSWLVVNGT